jgi:hypothetical protein
MHTKYKTTELRIISLIFKLMERKTWIEETFADLVFAEDQEVKHFHIQKLDQMIKLMDEETLPFYIKEFLVDENIRHFECDDCGTEFSPTEAYLLLSRKKCSFRWSGDSVYGCGFICCR